MATKPLKFIWLVTSTVLCLGLNLLIPRVKKSRCAKLVIGLLVLDEIRAGVMIYYTGVGTGVMTNMISHFHGAFNAWAGVFHSTGYLIHAIIHHFLG
jgi:hypothetical protein